MSRAPSDSDSGSGSGFVFSKSIWPAVLTATAFLLFVHFVIDHSKVFEFDSDDGNNVIKSLLLDRGHSFGDEIWSDQPPFFTFVVWGACKAFGWTMAVARGVVTAFSALLLFAITDSVRRASSAYHGVAAALLLFVTFGFVHLSVSIMIGLPAIALMALSLWSLVVAEELRRAHPEVPLSWRHPIGRQLLLLWAASGGFAALSLATKLFVAFMVPALGLFLLGWELRRSLSLQGASGKERLTPLLLSGGAFGLGFLALGLLAFAPLIEAGTWSGLINAHAASRARGTGSGNGLKAIASFLDADALVFGLALLGLLRAALAKHSLMLVWSSWLLLALAGLWDHHPVWTHHRTLLTVPAAALAGFTVGELLSLRSTAGTWAHRLLPTARLAGVSVLVALVLFAMPKRRQDILKPHSWSKSSTDFKIFKSFSYPAEHADYVAAARPSHAFRAGRPVPPNLAVTSSKRFATGLLTPADVAHSLEEYRPEVVLLSERWPAGVRRAVKKQIADSHRKVQAWRYQRTELWVETSLADKLKLERHKGKPRKGKKTKKTARQPRPQGAPPSAAAPSEKKER